MQRQVWWDRRAWGQNGYVVQKINIKKDLWIPSGGIPPRPSRMPRAGGRRDIYHGHGGRTWQDSTGCALHRLKIQRGCPAGSGSECHVLLTPQIWPSLFSSFYTHTGFTRTFSFFPPALFSPCFSTVIPDPNLSHMYIYFFHITHVTSPLYKYLSLCLFFCLQFYRHYITETYHLISIRSIRSYITWWNTT